MDKKAKFFKIYANLPLHFRTEIIAVVEGNPFTWNSAKLEVENDSEFGSLILDKLVKMEIINEQ